MSKLHDLFMRQQNTPNTESFWCYVRQVGFWTERDYKNRVLYLFLPETARPLRKQNKLLTHSDWIFNFIFIPFIGIHFGFLFQFLAIRKEVKKRAAVFNPDSIVIIGYSQGGAIGQLVNLYLKVKGYDVEGYFYGSPRVFSFLWIPILLLINLKQTLIINGGDIVTKVPFSAFGFMRYGIQKKIGRKRFVSFLDHTPRSYFTNL